jgi:hypothetical protein
MTFTGNFSAGMKQGQGKMTWSSTNTSYEG